MKMFRLLVILITFIGAAVAVDLASDVIPSVTIDGVVYEDVRIGRVTPPTVTIYHKKGIATVPLAELPPVLQKRCGYDPEVERQRLKRTEEERHALEEKQRLEKEELKKRVASERQRIRDKQTHRLEEDKEVDRLKKVPFAELKAKAEAGVDLNAVCALAACYGDGETVARDFEACVKWARLAAERGHARAQAILGARYLQGEGVPKDYREGLKWFRKSAEQESARGKCGIGVCYAKGYGTAQDDFAAMVWFGEAAEQGNALAQVYLGAGLLEGKGVAKDEVAAVKWFRLAAEQGQEDAQFFMGHCYYKGRGVSVDFGEAVKWLRKAAELGDSRGQALLGACYFKGEGVPEDYIEAYKWFNLAGSQGDKNCTRMRELMAEKMTPSQIAEGQRRAAQFVARKAVDGKSDSEVQPDLNATPIGSGTGFFIANEYLITNHHVVNRANAVRVVCDNESYKAQIIRTDAANDVAILKVSRTAAADRGKRETEKERDFASLPILSSRDIHLGDSVFTIGFPNPKVQGVQPKLTRGEISSLAGIKDDPRYFQMSVAVQPGNSGGALVDLQGNVVGVVTMRLDDLNALRTSGALPQNVNYSLKSSFLIAFLDTVPELAGKLKVVCKDKERRFDEVVKEVQAATVRVLVY